jgi:predicted thioesterase
MAAFHAGKRPIGLVDGRGSEVGGIVVTRDMTAERVGSGDLAVLASPELVAMVERAAVQLLRMGLPPRLTTVGASFALTHAAPTPVGAELSLRLTLEPGDSRKLRFVFSVDDDAGEIASGTHVRVIVERGPFMANAGTRRRQPADGDR